MKQVSILTALLFACLGLSAQMEFNGESIFGNEWVSHDRPYAKVTVNQDGVYRINYADLIANGFPNDIQGREIQAYSLGQEVALHVTSNGALGNGDYVEFFGFKNKGELDQPLFEDWEKQQLNPKHSMFSDERPYFFTWTPGSNNNLRYEQAANDLTGNLPTAESFYVHQEEVMFSSNHVIPLINEEDVRYSNFFTTEGYGSGMVKVNTVNLPTTNISTGMAISKLKIRFGTNAGNHIIRSNFNGDFLDSKNYNSYNVIEREFEIPTSDIESENEFVLEGTASNFDKSSIAYISLEYPRAYNASNQDYFRFSINPHSFRKYFEITDFNTAGGNPVVLDITNNVRVQSVVEGGVVKFALDSASSLRDLVIFNSPSDYVSITEKNFVDYSIENPNYVILTSNRLDITDNSGTNWIQEYADFRRSDDGDSYDVLVVHAEDILDQFGFGIKNHTLGIKNWSNFMYSIWNDWEHVFIVGKTFEYGILKQDNDCESFVPTHGEPGADNIMFSIGDNTYPEIGVGRLAAQNTDQIKIYYDKMITYVNVGLYQQSIEDKLWMKKVIHLSGGDAILQESIRGYLDDMATVLEESTFGANVITYQKTTSDPIQSSLSQSIIDQVNEGCSIITFFGHSAVGTFDFSIEEPAKFDNEGKTPIIISLGCHSGNIHTKTPGMSENFVLEPEKGAIAFLASSGTAYVSPQYFHGKGFYDSKGNINYGQPMGTILKNVLKTNTNNADFQVLTLQQQLTYHGDPALVLNSHEGPDYTPDISTFRTSPEVVSGRLDSIDVCFDIVNLGKHQFDTIDYYLVHKNAFKTDTFYFQTDAPFNSENNCHTIPINLVQAAGENEIEVYLDHVFEIDETPNPLAEMNNSLKDSYGIDSYKFFVINDNPIPFSPEEFAITNKDQLTLMASTGNGFVGSTSYEIEIDTTELFDSPFKQSAVVEARGGLVQWQPTISYDDYQVYYWRVRSANPQFGSSFWNNSSFTHIDEFSSGWNQSDLYQFLKDDFDNLEIDSTSRNFDYVLANYEFKILNRVRTADAFPEFSLNSTFLAGAYGNDIGGGLYIIIADPNTLLPTNCPATGIYGTDPGLVTEERPIFSFRTTDAAHRTEIIDFLTDIVPEGYYVFMYTIQDQFNHYNPQLWEDELFEVFENEGATQLRGMIEEPKPYVFAYQKGFGPVKEFAAANVEDEVNALVNIEAKWFEGIIASRTIGPAQTWNKFSWDISGYNETEDLFDVRIFGIDNTGGEDTLAINIENKEYDLSTISAAEYPYLRLELFTRDTISHTSLDLDYWRVVYRSLPEAVLNTTDSYVFHADTLERGEILNVEYLIENVSMSNMDSMLVRYSIVDLENNEIVSEDRKSPLQMLSSIPDKFEYNTQELDGLYQLRVEINPEKDQPEQFAFNNRGLINFLVRADDINPLLDVTFDGVRILDGDIISPSPMIKIALSDENQNQLIENPENFLLTLEYPDGSLEEIDVNGSSVNFLPASEENDYTACLEYTPTLTQGEYTLFAQGLDETGNYSGDHAYSVSFNVFEENLISNVLNYPNPFSTSTQFVFTITGNQLPQDYHVKIFTLSGKVVREITADQLGPIRVGVNRSEYKWNGTDEFGSKLANGVYLYKFYTDVKEELDEFSLEDVDKYFKEGFGKLVIMR